jgi:ATP-binding cassette subfamily B protein
MAMQSLVRLLAGVSLPPQSFAEVIAERVRLIRLLAWGGWAPLAVLTAGHVLAAAAPAALALTTGWLVSSLMKGPESIADVAPALAVFAVVLALQQVGHVVHNTAGLVVAQQIDRRTRSRVREVALTPPGIAHLEEPTFQDDALRVTDLGIRSRVRSPGTASAGQVVLVFRLVAALAAAVVVARFSVLLAVTLLALSLLMRAIVRTQWLALAAFQDGLAAEQRQVGYWTDLVIGEPAAKEMRLFHLGGWLTGRRTAAERSFRDRLWSQKNIVYGRQVSTAVLAACSAAAALLAPGLAVVNGTLGVDGLAATIAAAWGVFAISAMGHEAFDIEYGIGAVHALDRLTARPDAKPAPAHRSDHDSVSAPSGPPLIEFDGVGFGYPTSHTPVLDGVDLRIRPGEVVAIVGVNGAGKTTMTKLLGGLYQPTRGQIRIAGADLAIMDMAQWRRRVTILFQDFVHYPLTVAENVTASAADQPATNATLTEALRRADALDLLQHLPDGMDTQLTRLRTGGVDLSGGQWQRIALARVLYAVQHGRNIVVLDEPTAHLDVRSEAEFFDRVVGAVPQATVVLISHRLSTIRRADRIVLLNGGTITESGTHDELLGLDGEYARLFRLQAARFTDPTGIEEVTLP